MPMNTLIVRSTLCFQEVQTTDTLEGTQPAQGEMTYGSVEAPGMCPRGPCVCLCVVRWWEMPPPEVPSVGQELGPFPCSTKGAGEGNRSLLLEKNSPLFNSILLPLSALWREFSDELGESPSTVSPAEGSGGQWQQQVQTRMVQNCLSFPTSCLCCATRSKPPPSGPAGCRCSRLRVVGDAAAFRGKIIITRLQPLDSARRHSQKSFHDCDQNWI